MRRPLTIVIALLLTAACARSLWLTFAASSIAVPVGDRSPGEDQLQRMQRYRGLSEALAGVPQAGYIGRPNGRATWHHYFARYAALPTVLTHDATERVLVADFPDAADARRILQNDQWHVRRRLDDQLMILERTE